MKDSSLCLIIQQIQQWNIRLMRKAFHIMRSFVLIPNYLIITDRVHKSYL